MAFNVGAVTVIDGSRNITNTGSFQASIGSTTGRNGQVLMSSATGTGWISGAVLSGPLSAGYVGINTFTSPGTFTVGTNCPSAISAIRIYGCGGGGNGGAGQSGVAPTTAGGFGGGGGGLSLFSSEMRTVTNGQVFTITIAAAGGNTTVTTPAGPNLTFTGGGAGATGAAGGASGTTGTIPNGDIINSSYAQAGSTGSKSTFSINPVTDGVVGAPGGAGGSNILGHLGVFNATRLGTGGDGGVGRDPGSGSPTAGSAGSGNGAGGGGGAGGNSSPPAALPGKSGGVGTPGIVVIVY